MPLPQLMEPAEVAAYLGVSEDTLARWRSSGEGPASIRVGQRVAYTERAVDAYITAQETGDKSATPAQITAAMMEGSAARRAAMQARTKQLTDLDREDRESLNGVSPLVVSGVGETPGSNFQKFNSVPAQQFTAPAAPHILNNR